MKNFLPLSLVILLLLSSCSKDAKYDKEKAISVFANINKIEIDPNLAKTPIIIPKQQDNHDWNGAYGLKNQQIENLAKKFTLKKNQKINFDKSSFSWSFYKGDLFDRFLFSPVIKNDKVFFLKTSGVLYSYDLKTEKKIWKKRIFPRKFLKNYQTPKISHFNNVIFAIAGINRIVAVNESDGEILWFKDISAIPISSPVSDGDLVYVSTNDNKVYAFDFKSGKLQWMQSGVLRKTAIFGAADLVIYDNLLIAAYSSGEIYAVDKKTGESLWSNDLNISRAVSSDFYLNDIDATPVIKDDVIYAIGNGGLMMAINIKDGEYLWKKEISGIANFWLAGDFLFVINNDNKLLAIHKKTGGVKWISQLPNFKKEKKPTSKFVYNGLIMAGDKLLISRIDGKLLVASPFDGEIEKTLSVGKKLFHSPIVVDGEIYFYTLGKYLANLVKIN